jgi:aconitate hydratase
VGASVAQKLIRDHLVSGSLGEPGREIGLRIDQTLTQDATGTLVMLELEAMGLDRVRTEVSVQYVDHNLIQQDYKNADDHRFLRSAARRFGIWYSRPGNGVSHPVHMERFGKPGKTLLGSDSHTVAAGSLGMLAVGAGGLEVALAMTGEPLYLNLPEIWGVRLVGKLPDWVSAKDVILEMLRRHGVAGGVNRIVEYHGPGVANLSAMDRHVIANMGAELGATSTVFPSDERVREFLRGQGREDDWVELIADADATYDVEDEIDLSSLEPLVSLPTSPGNVVPVREVAGRPIAQAYVGSSANPGFRDIAVVAKVVENERVPFDVSLDINPASRQILENLIAEGYLTPLVRAGARIHQPGCNGCIGMGQAPPTDGISLRTVPRNFPGRSGTKGDQVYLVSPETAAASALAGRITDPRTLARPYPASLELENPILNVDAVEPPPSPEVSAGLTLVKGPNIQSLPEFDPLPEDLETTVLLRLGDDVSTDEIMPAGARVLPFRSNIEKISQFAFDPLADGYAEKALRLKRRGGHAIVAGSNYGQGSSREHAAIAPRFLGLRVVIAKSFARIHWQNLANFGVLPLTFVRAEDYDVLEPGARVSLPHVRAALLQQDRLTLVLPEEGRRIEVEHRLSERQLSVVLEGGLINWKKGRME